MCLYSVFRYVWWVVLRFLTSFGAWLLFMENKDHHVFQISTQNLQQYLVVLFFFFFILCLQNPCAQAATFSTTSPQPQPDSRRVSERERCQRIILSILFGVITGLLCSLVFGYLVRCFIQYINRTPILKGPVVFSPKIAPKTLQSALATENHLLGSSPNGNYYRTVLDNGLTIAVKRLQPEAPHSKSVKRKIQQELQLLAGLRHRNLMSLRAYVREESDRFSLVYDYVPTGSLEDAMKRLRQNQLQLSWDLRLRIAVGIIKGLQYLHFICIPRIMHYNLKPSNVMLYADFEPKLADSGLAKLMPFSDRLPSGYNAPECSQNYSRYSDKSDVFSFGVILGVLLTGRDPMDPFFGDPTSGGSLGRWLHHVQEAGEARRALDKSILGEELEEDEMLMALRIAVVCQSDIPADRPSSDELVPMLTQLHSF